MDYSGKTAAFQNIKSQGFLKINIIVSYWVSGCVSLKFKGWVIPKPLSQIFLSTLCSLSLHPFPHRDSSTTTFFQKSPQYFPFLKETILRGNEARDFYLCHTSLKQHTAQTPAWPGHRSTLACVSWGRPINWKMALFEVRILKIPLVIVNGRHGN